MRNIIPGSFIFLASLPGFAQSGGISGPGTSGSRLGSDERVLTRTSLEALLDGCMKTEILSIHRVVMKDPSFDFGPLWQRRVYLLGGGNPYVRRSQVAGDGQVEFPVRAWHRAQIYDNNYRGRLEVSISYYVGNEYKSRTLVAGQAPLLEYDEEALPNAYDEYGDIAQEKIVITRTQWIEREKGIDGSILVHDPLIQLNNGLTGVPVAGVFFNRARYKACVDLQLGKFARKAQ